MNTTRDEDERRGPHLKRALQLEWLTIGWNAGEAVLTIGLGIVAGSLALVGFGMDSIVEIFASAIVIWHFNPVADHEREGRERLALRLVAVAFLLLAAVLIVASLRDLLTGREAGESIFGIGYLAVTAVVMFALAAWKRRVADRLGSAPLHSEATMTFLDGILSVLTLTGLALNAWLEWWWADPGAALIIAVVALNEARENWKEASEVGEE